MSTPEPPVLELAGISRDYHGLRPLRIEALALAPAEQIAIVGVDQPMAETFVNLVTGAVLPEQGEVRVFGRPTAVITDSTDWLAVVDRFGIVSERAVLLDPLSVVQNLAIPFTLDIEPPSDDVRERAAAIAREVGLLEDWWERPVAELGPVERARIRLGRALALDPVIVILEHANAGVPRRTAAGFGSELRDILARRGTASIALTMDAEFAVSVAARVLTLEPATGRLSEHRRRSWFRPIS